MEFPDKWYIKGSQKLQDWSRKELDNRPNVTFYDDQYFYDAREDFIQWNWIEDGNMKPVKGYTEITFEQFVNYYEYSKNPFPINKSIDGNYLKPLLKKLGI